jgi:hypothetical protein
LIPENQTDVIQYALLQAALEEEVSFYHLTIKYITMLAKMMNKVMVQNGFKIYVTRERKECLLQETQVLCETK